MLCCGLCPSTLSPQGTLSDSTRQDGDRESHRAVQAALAGKQHKPVLGERGKGAPVGGAGSAGRGLWKGLGLSGAGHVGGKGSVGVAGHTGEGEEQGESLSQPEVVGGATQGNV